MSVAANLHQVKIKMAKAAARSGREVADIKIVAVTKGVTEALIEEAVGAGLLDIGENRVQELLPKSRILGAKEHTRNVVWHFVGSLQRNKVKYLVGWVELIHSVDRLSLVAEIDKQAKKKGVTQKVLVQVNIAGEATKHGVAPGELMPFLVNTSQFSHVSVQGLMAIAPLKADVEEVRKVFSEMRRLYDEAKKAAIDGVNMCWLSMGMTQDFEVGIEEGSNMVRIGRALFDSMAGS